MVLWVCSECPYCETQDKWSINPEKDLGKYKIHYCESCNNPYVYCIPEVSYVEARAIAGIQTTT